MKAWKLVIVMALFGAYGHAQERYAYRGPELKLGVKQYTSEKVADLQGEHKLSYQGMDIWNDCMVSLQNTGVATTYRLQGADVKKVGQFKLGSYAKTNHANVASFSSQFYAKSDKLPLLFVSQCYDGVVDGMKDVIYVERIADNMKSSKLVAIINYTDVRKMFGYAVQWVVDRQNGYLYAFGNTVNNLDESNKHRLMKFKLPMVAVAKGKSKIVPRITLTDRQIVENYLIEDYYPHYYKEVGQGLFVKNGQLFMPVGLGTKEHPSKLYVWDLAKRKMRNVIDMSRSTQGELEDCSDYYGELMIQTQGSLYKVIFE